ETLITDPSSVNIKNQKLCYQDKTIPFIYNRLTDFFFTERKHAALLNAFKKQYAVFTPNPLSAFCYAAKEQLCFLSDDHFLSDMRVHKEDSISILTHLPRTLPISAFDPADLCKNKYKYLFKPSIGYGSKGVYSGAKLTQKTFQN